MTKPLLTLFAVAGLATSLLAQPTPPPRPEPPKESRPILGVAVLPAPEALSAQLKLPRGMGLVVEFAPPREPASVAGVQQYDVLTKYDDQLLVNSDQLIALVRNQDIQKPVKLTLFREGVSREITVKLEVREVPVHAGPNPMQGHLQRGLPIPGPLPFQLPLPNPRADHIKVFTTSDKQGTFTLRNQEGKKIVHFVDPEGKVVFEGDVEQQEHVPDIVRKKLEEVERHEAPAEDVLRIIAQPEEGPPGI